MLILHTNARKKTTAALICFKNLHSNFLVIVLKGTYDRFPYFLSDIHCYCGERSL